MDGNGQLVGAGSFRDRVQDGRVHAVKKHARAAGLEDGLDSVHAPGLEFIHLLFGLGSGFGQPGKLRVEGGLHGGRQVLGVLRAVTAFGGEERTANKELSAHNLAAVDQRTRFQAEIELVTHALDGGHTAVEVGSEFALYVGRGALIILRVLKDSTGGAQVDVHVDQAGQHGLARGLDYLSVQRLGVGRRRVVDLGDFAVAHQDRARLDHLTVADND